MKAVPALAIGLFGLLGSPLVAGDFCLYGQHRCSSHATCYIDDTQAAGYRCVCKPDWEGNGITCTYSLCNQAQYALQNGNFELPDITKPPYGVNEFAFTLLPKADVPNWKSTEDSIEIWRSGFNGVPTNNSAAGKQFAEIQANKRSALFQDIYSKPGTKLIFEFLHHGRQGVDTITVIIGPADPPVPVVLPKCSDYVKHPDTTLTRTWSTGLVWAQYTVGPYTVPPGQTTTRVMFCASAQATACESCGNLIDNVQLKPPECYIDPCTTGSHNCDPNAQCIHGVGDAYSCQCNTGYSGNGYTCYNPNVCRDGIFDAVIVMDASNKLTISNGLTSFNSEKSFVKQVLGQTIFNFAPDQSRASVMYYGPQVTGKPPIITVPITGQAATDLNKLNNAIDGITLSSFTGTPLNRGVISAAASQITQNPRKAQKFILLITAGMQSATEAAVLKTEADNARAAGISIIGVSVGTSGEYNLPKYGITTNQLWIQANSFNTIGNTVNDVVQRVCERVPRDGGWGDWSLGECSKTCGDGLRPKTRLCNSPYPNTYGSLCSAPQDGVSKYDFVSVGGVNTLQHTSSDYCKKKDCPVNCQLSDWTLWSDCVGTCTGATESVPGKQSRTRYVKQEAMYGGLPCEEGRVENKDCQKTGCPVDCQVGDWVAWANCDALTHCIATSPNASGLETRTRPIIRSPNAIGQKCPNTTETQRCSRNTCPVNCQWGDWTQWTACDAFSHCDRLTPNADGLQLSSRTFAIPPQNQGKPCDGLPNRSMTCSVTNCPVDCRVSQWTTWTLCNAMQNCSPNRDKNFANGTMTRERSQEAGTGTNGDGLNGGNKCPSLFDSQSCSTGLCPVDCKLSDWSEWSQCSAQCGGNLSKASGLHSHSRTVVRPANNTGKACEATWGQEACSIQCSVDCMVSDWSEWVCNATSYCDRKNDKATGTQTRSRKVVPNGEGIEGPQNGGEGCPEIFAKETCQVDDCPVDCVVGAWSDWSCDAERNCKAANTPGVVEVVKGTKTRTRTNIPPRHGGAACPADFNSADCYTGSEEVPLCPKDCMITDWTDWSDWGQCQNSIHSRTRTRQIIQSSNSNGKNCSESDLSTLVETLNAPFTCSCESNGDYCCPTPNTNPQWSPWSVLADDFRSKCDPSGDENSRATISFERTRTRELEYNHEVLNTPELVAQNCPASKETETIGPINCPLDCLMGDVHESECEHTCGDPWDKTSTAKVSGQITVTRPVTRPKANDGKECDAYELSHTKDCEVDTCPLHCLWSEWSVYDTCTVTCGGGFQTRTRTVAREAANQGTACNMTTNMEVQPCNVHNCPIDCTLSKWSDWSCDARQQCDGLVESASGNAVHTRYVEQPAQYGGKCNDTLTETEPCSFNECNVPCEVTGWSEWQCNAKKNCTTAATANGTESRSRTVSRQPLHPAEGCPALDEERPCTVPCDVDCKLSNWTDFGVCSNDCGDGERTRTRQVLVAPQNNGAPCEPVIDSIPCTETSGCPVNCNVTEWSVWAHTVACDGHSPSASGPQTRSRTVTTEPKNGGKPCPPLVETGTYSIDCNVDCVPSGWSEWSQCDTFCGNGTETRHRGIDQPRYNNGSNDACEPLDDQRGCTNTSQCPVPCAVADWSDWSPCEATCDGTNPSAQGTTTRSRDITQPPLFNGADCPILVEKDMCHQDCAVSCSVSGWGEWTVCMCNKDTNRTRDRYVLTSPVNGGAECPTLSMTENCTTSTCTKPVIVVPADNTPVIAGAAVGAAAAAALAGVGVLLWARKNNLANLATLKAMQQDAMFNAVASSSNPLYQEAVIQSDNPLYGVAAE